MTLSLFRFKGLFILSACALTLPIYATAPSTETPYCNGEQLAIYQIASDAPGMSQTRTLYGILNTSQKSCRLNGTPAVWGINNHHKIYLSKDPKQNGPSVLVEPVSQNTIASDKLVWFSIHGSGAMDGPPSPFSTLQIILPGVANRIYTVPYDGYNPSGLSPLQKNAALWDALQNDTCPGFTGKVWPIYFTKTVDCG